jgi:hypothetical protein
MACVDRHGSFDVRGRPRLDACGALIDPVPRYLLANAEIGAVLGALWALALLLTDTSGIGSLIASSDNMASTVTILLVGGATILAPFVVATALGHPATLN